MFQISLEQQQIENERVRYRYGHGYLHNGNGVSIQQFVDLYTAKNYAYGFDGHYKDGWDGPTVDILNVKSTEAYVDVEIQTGLIHKIDRLYHGLPILEIIYQRNEADWTEDFIRADGAEDEIAFVMYGMADVVGLVQGKALWAASEKRCDHNYGDCFIAVNGSDVATCTYKGYFIYGFINEQTGHGAGFVYPTWITTCEWKVWWTEQNKIEIEYAPHGQTGKRWIYAVTQGKSEIVSVGQSLVDNDGASKLLG